MPSKDKIVPAPIISLGPRVRVIHDALREDDGYGKPIPAAIFVLDGCWTLLGWSESRWT
jgi:hypothetical protein